MLKLLMLLGCIALCKAQHSPSIENEEIVHGMNVSQILSDPSYHIIDKSVKGNHTYILRSFTDQLNGIHHQEAIEFVTISEDFADCDGFDYYSDDLVLHADELHGWTHFGDEFGGSDDTRVKRQEKCCNVVSNQYCYWVANDGRVIMQLGFKNYECLTCPLRRVKLRFYARFAGVYVLRIVNQKGSYVVVIQTYKKHQIVTFLCPQSVHLGSYYKVFLMVYPDCDCNLFDGSFRWNYVDAEEVLGGRIGCSHDDFSLIFRQKNVVFLEQMSRLNVCRFVKIGSCSFPFLE